MKTIQATTKPNFNEWAQYIRTEVNKELLRRINESEVNNRNTNAVSQQRNAEGNL